MIDNNNHDVDGGNDTIYLQRKGVIGAVPTIDTVKTMFTLPGDLDENDTEDSEKESSDVDREVAKMIRGITSDKLVKQLDDTLSTFRKKQLEEVVERKKKLNSLLKDPSLYIQ